MGLYKKTGRQINFISLSLYKVRKLLFERLNKRILGPVAEMFEERSPVRTPSMAICLKYHGVSSDDGSNTLNKCLIAQIFVNSSRQHCHQLYNSFETVGNK